MSIYDKTKQLLSEYIVGDPDRHGGNYLVDVPNQRIITIDLGRAFLKDGLPSRGFVPYVWERTMVGDMALDKTAIANALAQKDAVIAALHDDDVADLKRSLEVRARSNPSS